MIAGYVFILCVFLNLPLLTQEMTEEDFKKKMVSDLKDYLQKHESGNIEGKKLTPKQIRLWKMLLNSDSDPESCEKQVIRYFRERYVFSEINSKRYLFSKNGQVIYPFARYLYFLKNKPSGLYEYTKLTGFSAVESRMNNNIVKSGQYKNNLPLLKYDIYILARLQSSENIKSYTKGNLSFFNPFDRIKRMDDAYGKNPLMKLFHLNYIFHKFSYINIAKMMHSNRRGLNMDTFETLLLDYYSSFIVEKTFEAEFLSKIFKEFGPKVFENLVLNRINNYSSTAEDVMSSLLNKSIEHNSSEMLFIVNNAWKKKNSLFILGEEVWGKNRNKTYKFYISCMLERGMCNELRGIMEKDKKGILTDIVKAEAKKWLEQKAKEEKEIRETLLNESEAKK